MYKLKPEFETTKGMIFAGCSFTWGQGLYYYSNLPSIVEPLPHHYDPNLVHSSHYSYLQKVRYPRLVANHFDCFETCQPFNGGATYSILEWWNNTFADTVKLENVYNGDWSNPKYSYSDYSHIFFQFTQWHRSHSPAMIEIDSNGNPYKQGHFVVMKNKVFNKWLDDNNLTLDQYIHNSKLQDINDIKQFLQKFEEKGVKAYVLSWPDDIVPYILNDEWLSSRFIDFEYKGITYRSIEEMMGSTGAHPNDVKHPELTIFRDSDTFVEPPIDHHPSPLCHQVVAQSIIRRLEKDKNE